MPEPKYGYLVAGINLDEECFNRRIYYRNDALNLAEEWRKAGYTFVGIYPLHEMEEIAH